MTGTPVVFIHGLWLHSTSWASWIELFTAAGYDPIAPGWPREPDTVAAANANPEAVANHVIQDVNDHLSEIIASLSQPPILIGHSFGGLFAEKLLGEDKGVAAIGIDAAQIKGVLRLPISALHSTLPVFKNPANLHCSLALTADEFAYSFGNALPRNSDALHTQWAIPSPGKPLFEAAVANFSWHSPAQGQHQQRGPLLLIMGKQEHTVPEVITKATVKQYRHSTAVTELLEFDRGHSLTIDHSWREVAEGCLDLLKTQRL